MELNIKLAPELTPVWQLWIGTPNIAELACEKTVKTVYSRDKGYQYIKLLWKDLPDSLKSLKGRAKAQTADVVRFWLLAKYGGVWFDSDIIARKEIPFRLWLKSNKDAIIHINHSVNDINWASNGGLACNAGNITMQKVFDISKETYEKKGALAWTGCGPQVLTNVLKTGSGNELSLAWKEWAHEWTNSDAQKRYRYPMTPTVQKCLNLSGNWYYAHVTGAGIKQHAKRKTLADDKTVFCRLLAFVYNELGLELK